MVAAQNPEEVIEHPARIRLEEQLLWYDNKSCHYQKCYKCLNLSKVILAIAIPFMCFISANYSSLIMALFGGMIAIIESIQQMQQYSTLWVTYRSTAECLKHEKFLFLSSAGPYKDLIETDRFILLAERVEEHVSSEHANWFNEIKRITTEKN